MECPQRTRERGQRIDLRRIQVDWLGRWRQPSQPKRLRPLLDPHQPAPHQCLQRRRRQLALAAAPPAASRRRTPPAPPESPAASRSAWAAAPSGTSTANRSMRRASRSAAAVSRAIHFLRTIAASTGSDAAVAVRSVDTFTGSPEASRSSTRRSMSCAFARHSRRLAALSARHPRSPQECHPERSARFA